MSGCHLKHLAFTGLVLVVMCLALPVPVMADSGHDASLLDLLLSVPERIGSFFISEGSPCDDRNPCTTGDHYHQGTCSGEAVTCDDGNPGTLDFCDPSG
jgi:hypothetical protein